MNDRTNNKRKIIFSRIYPQFVEQVWFISHVFLFSAIRWRKFRPAMARKRFGVKFLNQQIDANQRGSTTSNRLPSMALMTAAETNSGLTTNKAGDFGGMSAKDLLKSVRTGPGHITDTSIPRGLSS